MFPHCAAECGTSLVHDWAACLCTYTQTTTPLWKGCGVNLRWHTGVFRRLNTPAMVVRNRSK
jgi:hypothetical protein